MRSRSVYVSLLAALSAWLVAAALAGSLRPPALARDGDRLGAAGLMARVHPFYLRLGLPDLVAASDTIVAGTIHGPPAAVVGPTGIPEQRWQVVVDRVLKGGPGSALTLAVPGGDAGGASAVVHEQAAPVVGDRVLLFLYGANGRHRVTGGWQGYLPLDGATVTALQAPIDAVANAIAQAGTGQPTPFDDWVAPGPPAAVHARYALTGSKWYPNAMPVAFYVNPIAPTASLTISQVSQGDFEQAFVRSFLRWKDAPANLTFEYRGITDRRVPEPNIGSTVDRLNLLQWGGQHVQDAGSSTLGLTLCWSSTGNPLPAVDCDIEINTAPAAAFTIAAIDDLSAPIPAGTVDLYSVILHEVGHFWGLSHPDGQAPGASDTVMHASIRRATNKRSLRPDDVEGIQSLYGTGPAAPPTATATATATATRTPLACSSGPALATTTPSANALLTQTVKLPLVINGWCGP